MKRKKPHMFQIDGGWKCIGMGHWDCGSTMEIAYERWYLHVYKRLPSKK